MWLIYMLSTRDLLDPKTHIRLKQRMEREIGTESCDVSTINQTKQTLVKCYRDKKRILYVDKWSIHQGDVTIINKHTPDNRALKYMKQKN